MAKGSRLRQFFHWFAHLMDDREPSTRDPNLIRGQDGVRRASWIPATVGRTGAKASSPQ
jgi:hypothetical protein